MGTVKEHRPNEARGTVANVDPRNVKEREGTRSAEMPAKIAASRNVGGGIVGDRTRSAQKVGFEICCISFIVLLSTWFSPAFDLLYVIVILYDSMTTCLSIVYHL